MDKNSIYRLSPRFFCFLVAAFALAACTNKAQKADPAIMQVTQEQLRAYCPSISLRDGTAFYTAYQKNGQNDPEKVTYQAALRDMTRTCNYTDTALTMKVATAGRVIAGPAFKTGTINMPIRVVVLEADKVVYSKLHKYSVKMDNANTTQFIFVDDQIILPKPTSRNMRVYVGYDIAQN